MGVSYKEESMTDRPWEFVIVILLSSGAFFALLHFVMPFLD
jgi:hypothetical protein